MWPSSVTDYASINSSGAHPPWATVGHLLTLSVPGEGHLQFYHGPGGWALAYPGASPGHVTRVFERQISSLGRTRPLSKTGLYTGLVLQGLGKLVDVFFIPCKYINISGELYSVSHKAITDVNTTILHFAFKASLAIFKFMKVELKYWRFMNSNDPIFKTDLGSLKYSKPVAFIQENI